MKLQPHDLNYFLSKHFFGDDSSQDILPYPPIRDTLELKKSRELFVSLVRNHRDYIHLNLSYYILLSCIVENLLDIKFE